MYRITTSGAGRRSREAAASAGMCNAWQMWQALSGPVVCWCSSDPPVAKYKIAAQATRAKARRANFRSNLIFSRFMNLHRAVSLRRPSNTNRYSKKVRNKGFIATDCLTPQPFRPKLRLTYYMPGKVHSKWILALLLAVVFVGAQFHFCADLTATPSGSHICPLCSTTTVFVAAQSPVLAVVPVSDRLEDSQQIIPVPVEIPRSTSPRAPPAV